MEQKLKKTFTTKFTVPQTETLLIPVDQHYVARMTNVCSLYPGEIDSYRRRIHMVRVDGAKTFPFQVAVHEVFYIKMSEEELSYRKNEKKRQAAKK